MRTLSSRRSAIATCVAALLCATTGSAFADTFPSKAIDFIVPYPPGGASDIIARLIAERLQASLKQPVVVENRAGANGMIAYQYVAKAPADGYTILMANIGPSAINPSIYKKMSYDAVKDFAPITLVSWVPLMVVANPGLRVNSVAELIAKAKAAPGTLSVGPRLGEMTTSGYTLLQSPVPTQKLVHVHAGAEELGSVYEGELLIHSGMARFADALAALPSLENASRWCAATAAARNEYDQWTGRVVIPGDVQMWDVMAFLRERVPADSIITNGAGNYTVWAHRFYRYRGFRTQLAPTSGAMGYGVPAAVAAKIVHPERMVIAFAGDGCFLMNGQELATAVKERANLLIIVVNNGMYGTIRMHQEREYPARVIATDLVNPDFAAFARSFGAHGETVAATDQFPAAFERAVASGKPALIEVRIDPDAITPNTTITAMRRNAATKA